MAKVEELEARRYTLGRPEARSLLGRRERGEVAVLVAGGAAGLAAALLVGGAPGFVLLAVCLSASAAVVYLPFRGRTPYRWVPVMLRFTRQRRVGAATYVSGAREAGVNIETGGALDVVPPTVIGRLNWISYPYKGGQLAVLGQLDEACLTSVVEVEGPGIGWHDQADQEQAVGRWGLVLRDLANSEGFISRMSLIERCLPADPEAHARYIAERAAQLVHPALAASYDELAASAVHVSEQHRNYIVLRMAGGAALSRVADARGGGDEGFAAVMAREIEQLTDRLADADIKVVQVLDVPRLAALIASLYNPDYPVEPSFPMGPRDAWPAWACNHEEFLQVGRWHHAVAWVKTWPLVGVRVNFLSPMLVQTPGVIHTVAATMDLTPTDAAMAKVLRDLTADEAELAAAARQGRTRDPRMTKQIGQVDQRAADLANGAGGARVVGYVAVSAPSLTELERAKRKMTAAGHRSYLTLEWCDYEHDRAFANVLPLARGLR